MSSTPMDEVHQKKGESLSKINNSRLCRESLIPQIRSGARNVFVLEVPQVIFDRQPVLGNSAWLALKWLGTDGILRSTHPLPHQFIF